MLNRLDGGITLLVWEIGGSIATGVVAGARGCCFRLRLV